MDDHARSSLKRGIAKKGKLPRAGIICFMMIAFFLLPHAAYPQKIVQSSGVGVILKGNVEGARKLALEKSLKGAVQEVIANIFNFSDLSNYNQAVEGLQSEDPGNYIERYRILTDKRDENLYKIEVEVWVSDEKIKERLSDAGLVRYSKEVLRLGILVGTKLDDQLPRDFFSGESRNFTLFAAQQCRTRGFQVINGSISVDDSPKSFEKLRVNNQLTALQGRRLGADAVVLGQVQVRSEASRLGLQIPGDYHVTIWVRAIRSTDADLLGIRETSFTLKQNISRFMLRQLIQQNLDSVLAALGTDVRANMN